MRYDYCVIGGGIVGLATARELLVQKKGAKVVLIEKENQLARHQTGHNSGVIHAGVYYKPGSLKARLCRAGAVATKAFCDRHAIAYKTCGKLIVATDDEELGRMRRLLANARENEIEIISLSAGELMEREPNITGVGALLVPASGIVDYREICAALAREIVTLGGEIVLGSEVDSITETSDAVNVTAGGKSYSSAALIACAGLQSDRLARMAGLAIDHQIVPFRGEYYDIRPERAGLVQHMIYPVPDPALPFLGIHLTPTIEGGLTVGPNAVLGLAREGYKHFSMTPKDVAEMLGFPGFWRLMRQQWRSGMAEMANSLSKARYLEECRKYCPDLGLNDLRPREAGIRAQAVMRDGSLVHDFLFSRTARSLHVGNAPSPAATSAFPIAQMIVETLTTGA